MLDILFAALFAVCGVVLLAVALGLIPERLAAAIRQQEEE